MGYIRVGKPDVKIDHPSHVPMVPQGNGGHKRQPGHNKDGTVDARRSTGVHASRHDPILKVMPNLPPG